jgi:hypothetical protein
MEAVVVGGELANVEVKGLFGQSIKWIRNIDQSPPVASHSERDFYGVQATYKGLTDHQPFFYYLWQQDGTHEKPEDPNQEYDYDSQYLGVGSTGRAVLRNLYYQTELVWEHGRDFGFGSTAGQDPICALAYDLNLTYVFQDRHRPEASFEYLFASGDSDRVGSPTNTIGGNLPGTDDHGFNGFGFRNTGLAFAPPISNVHMFRVGGDFRPLPDNRAVENLLLGADFFYFLKAEAAAAGPALDSLRHDLDLGPEVDVYCNWRITSDLLWTVRYGVFLPGGAFSEPAVHDCRNFLFTGLSFSF